MQTLMNTKDVSIIDAPHPNDFTEKTVIKFLIDKARIVQPGDDIIVQDIIVPKMPRKTVLYSIVQIVEVSPSKSYPDKKIISARVFRHVS